MSLKIQLFIASRKANFMEHLQAKLSKLNEPNLLDPFQIITDADIKEANDANMLDPVNDEDINISKLCRLY